MLGTPGRSVQANNPAGYVKPAFSPTSQGGVAAGGSRDAAAGSSSWSQADVAADSVRIS